VLRATYYGNQFFLIKTIEKLHPNW
ncbi:hypothetical protein AZZ66_003957, partial [Escherichia coli]